MGLGNNMGMGKAKGKSKPEIIKRVREVRTAKRYLSFTGSALATEQRDACRLRDINITYYHNGRNPIPRAGEIVYREKRARGDNRFGPGYIQFQDDRGRGFTIEINERGVVVGPILPC
tara:strand:- start:984 stop:1337 length:354 start_codon:yes stop_codon:yes gene_type:complete